MDKKRLSHLFRELIFIIRYDTILVSTTPQKGQLIKNAEIEPKILERPDHFECS